MKGWVGLEKLRIECCIGVTEKERAHPQTILVTAALEVAFPKSDELTEALDYRSIEGAIVDMAHAQPYHLVETLAQKIYHALLGVGPVTKVRLRVEKPAASSQATSAFVQLESPAEVDPTRGAS